MAEIYYDDDISYEEQNVSEETVSININKKYVPLKDAEFIEAAGLQRTGTSGRKSSVEKMLELSLNTSESYEDIERPSSRSPLTNGVHVSSDSDDDGTPRRGGRVTSEKPQNLKSDDFIRDAGLSRTGRVARKSSMEKLLEDQLQTAEDPEIADEKTTSTRRKASNGDVLLIRENSTDNHKMLNKQNSLTRQTSTSSNESETKQERSPRKNSIYEQKQIEAPKIFKGNRISARTDHLFKQYQRDMSIHEPTPIENVNEQATMGARKASLSDAITGVEEKRKVDIVREEKERELVEMRVQYQQRLAQEEQEEAEERAQKNAQREVKTVKSIGDIKNRYLAKVKGETRDSDSDGEDGTSNPDVVKGGGKEGVVKSSDGVGNIRERFGSIGKAGWKKRNIAIDDRGDVDSSKVNSARDLFKTFEHSNANAQQKKFVRPTSRKVRDPKELMEMRKKITYGGDNEELPQDGVVKRSVILDETELGFSSQNDALNVYKNLENLPEGDNSPMHKPKTRLLSDSEAMASMEVKKIENNDDEGVSNDEDVSGYDTGTPCSPTSTGSDGYSTLSDTREVSKEEEYEEKDQAYDVDMTLSVSKNIKIELTLNEDESSDSSFHEMNGHTDDSSFHVINGEVEEESDSESEDVYENVILA